MTESERAELLRLRKENANLKLHRAFRKKASICFAQGSIRYERKGFELIWANKNSFTITRMVHLLEVSRSDYCAWVDRAPSPLAIRRVHIEH